MVTLKSDPFIIDCAFKCDWNWNGCKCAYASSILLIYTVYPSYSTLNWLYAIIYCSRVYVCLCGWSIPSTDIHQFHVESNCWASFCFCFAIFCDPSELWNRIPIYEHRVDNIMQFHLIPFDSIRFVSFPCMCIHPFCYIH